MSNEADARIIIDRLLRDADWGSEDKEQVPTEEATAVPKRPSPITANSCLLALRAMSLPFLTLVVGPADQPHFITDLHS
jgi:hypothetical protein